MSNSELVKRLLEGDRDLMSWLLKEAKIYSASGMPKSVRLNKHLNGIEGVLVNSLQAEEVLVDFLNFVGQRRGVDLGLNRFDLKD